jgi:hypothetical protein
LKIVLALLLGEFCQLISGPKEKKEEQNGKDRADSKVFYRSSHMLIYMMCKKRYNASIHARCSTQFSTPYEGGDEEGVRVHSNLPLIPSFIRRRDIELYLLQA